MGWFQSTACWHEDGIKIVGSYWFALMQFGFLLLPLTDLVAGLLHLASVPAATFTPILGWIDVVIIVLVMIRGSYNARSPILRKYEITIPKKQATGSSYASLWLLTFIWDQLWAIVICASW